MTVTLLTPGARLFLLDDPPTLAGWGGFKGPPRDGTVEQLERLGFVREGEAHDEEGGTTWRWRHRPGAI